MMVDPETYVENYLKGKTVEEVKEIIEIIKEEILHCQIVLKYPDCHKDEMSVCPSPDTRLQMNELYLKEAEAYLENLSGVKK